MTLFNALGVHGYLAWNAANKVLSDIPLVIRICVALKIQQRWIEAFLFPIVKFWFNEVLLEAGVSSHYNPRAAGIYGILLLIHLPFTVNFPIKQIHIGAKVSTQHLRPG